MNGAIAGTTTTATSRKASLDKKRILALLNYFAGTTTTATSRKASLDKKRILALLNYFAAVPVCLLCPINVTGLSRG